MIRKEGFILVQFSYNDHSVLTKIKVLNSRSIVTLKVDTGSPITLLSCKSLHKLTGYSIDEIRRFIDGSDALTFHGVGGASIRVVPCSIRNIILGDENTVNNKISIDLFTTFVTDDNMSIGLLGMDFLEACVVNMTFGRMQIVEFYADMFLKKFKDNCRGIKISEINALSSKKSIQDLLSQAEGNRK